MHQGHNSELRGLLVEAGWNGQDLVRAVNAAGREIGAELRYQRTSAAQWLAGVRPRPPAPDLIAEVLARRLGRPVTPTEAGLRGGGAVRGGGRAPSAVEWQQSAEKTLSQDPGESSHAFIARGLEVPWFGQSSFGKPGSARGRTPTLTRDDVISADSALDAYSRADHAFGGGHSRQALAQHLSTAIAPLLGLPAPADIRRDLLGSAAKLAYLCGFMHFDDAPSATTGSASAWPTRRTTGSATRRRCAV